jgi:outer membrane lipoprotein carrier protein
MSLLASLLLLSSLITPFTAQDVALKTEEKIRSLHSIQAKFEQIYYSSTVSMPLEEKGNFNFQKPDSMRWEYKDPEEKTYLLKDGVFWEYIPEENQATKYDLEREGYESDILALLSGQKGILDNYQVEFSPFPTEDKSAYQLKLTPRKEEEEDSFILLEINDKNWLIQKAIFFDWAGNKTEYIFSSIKTNVKFPHDFFELRLPQDVEIIEHRDHA